tara:strand:- start:438 stop:797 length:360 start_codon:yes stop_codon:yes gene_type:complete
MSEKTCEERIDAALYDRAEDFIEIYRMADWDSLNEYGLALDKVKPDLLKMTQEERQAYEGDYIRYQISWGGPSEEIRFYDHKIEFVLMDWWDSAKREISTLEWAQWLNDYFKEIEIDVS